MIINPFASIPVHAKSHVRGWAQHWANLLETNVAHKCHDYSNEKVLYLDHGVNYGGGLNLFGGVTDEVFENLTNLIKSKAELFSLDIDMPDYATMLRKRIGQATCHKDLPLIIGELESVFKSAQKITQFDITTKNIAIGDSHATAYADKDSAVIRTNGQTLYGALRDGHIQKQMAKTKMPYDKVTLCFGAIDIRHHLMRQDEPLASLKSMLDDYIILVDKMSSEHNVKIEVAAPPPVEFENRRIPQTGFYKGTPFYGSVEDRKNLTMFFIGYLIDAGVKVIHQPIDRYSIDPEQYSKEYMELGSSVHIAPIHYRSNSNWGI